VLFRSPAAGIGKLDQQGASMGVRDVNAAGGVLGRCLKEDLKDDEGTPTKAAQVVRELIDQDGVKFIVGPFFSSPTSVTIPVMNQAKVININESSFTAAGDPTQYPYTFKREVNTDQQAATFIPFLQANHWKTAAILAVNNALGTILVPAVQQLAQAAGITITKVVFVNSGSPDVTAQMSELKSTNPQVLLGLVTADPDQVAMIKAKLALDWKIPLAGFSTIAGPGTVNSFSKAQLNGVYAGQTYKTLTYKSARAGQGKPTFPPAIKFVREFAHWINAHNIKETISQPSGGYDSVERLAWAINGAKTTDADAVKNFMETHAYVGVRGKYIWSKSQHYGMNLPMLAFGVANSLNNYGLLRLAPGQ
jgi:branched-chain amino acid transport system substrate-binding protein